MRLPQKTRYALRAIFELARRHGSGPVKTADIAAAQAIPERFLEVILCQLKQGGFVGARRGSRGGYSLLRSPETIAIGEIIRFVQGPVRPVECDGTQGEQRCPLFGDCVFLPVWQRVQEATEGVLDTVSFDDLVQKEKQRKPSYSI